MPSKVGDGLLAVSVMCGPWLWVISFIAAGTAWQGGVDGMSMLRLLGVSFFLLSLALWGIVSGPLRLRYWWFGLASLANLIEGGWLATTDHPHHGLLALVFCAYSLWQAVMFERLRTEQRMP